MTADATLHFASGVDWLGFKVTRPLRVLFIDEGPREPFRAKLELRRKLWPHEIAGAIFVQTFDWGAFTLADEGYANRLREFVTENEIDLVIGDPLGSLGVDGVGSPEDTRKFMTLMGRAGLFSEVAFLLLHHPRKEGAQDELDEVSGAWGGKPDTMLRLEKLNGNRARLSFPKIRWSRRSTRPDGKWRTSKEISAPKDGIGASEKTVRALLEKNPDRFVSRTGDEAKEVGRRSVATVWQLLEPEDQDA